MPVIPEWVAAGAICACSGAFAWGAVAPSSQLFGPTIRRTGDAAAMALTFDDGPNPAITPALLELLAKHEIPATFFLIGERIRGAESIVKEIAARGHAIGNHTHTHANLTFQSPGAISSELDRCDDAIASATGERPRWMRPPFGYRSPFLGGIVRKREARVAMWSVWARDWNPQHPDAVMRRLRRAKGGDIVLLHDGDHRTAEGDRRHVLRALEYCLPRWKDAGLRFTTMENVAKES